MEFFTSAIDALKVLVIALGADLNVGGVINLLEGYGKRSRTTKQVQAAAPRYSVKQGQDFHAEIIGTYRKFLNYTLYC